MAMSDTNTAVQLDWLDKTQIYAVLSVAEDLQEASETLQDLGVEISPRRLWYYQKNGNGRLQRMQQSGKAKQFLGREGRYLERIKRMDRFTQWLENQIMALNDPDKLDRERAAVIHRYREIQQLLCEVDGPQIGDNEPESAARETETAGQVQEGLSLLELIGNGQPPDEVFDYLVSDAARRVAAAAGTTFPRPESHQPSVASPNAAL